VNFSPILITFAPDFHHLFRNNFTIVIQSSQVNGKSSHQKSPIDQIDVELLQRQYLASVLQLFECIAQCFMVALYDFVEFYDSDVVLTGEYERVEIENG
jgi:hypothetical protein